jgi:hypothetical protein
VSWRAESQKGVGVGRRNRSALRDCWWIISPASGREYPPVGTEAIVAWAILWIVWRRAWGAASSI